MKHVQRTREHFDSSVFRSNPRNTKLDSPLDWLPLTGHLTRHGHEIVTSSARERERGRLGIAMNVGAG
jgi:hypothetical protein